MKKRLIGLYELISGIFGVILIVVTSFEKIDSVETFFQVALGAIMFAGIAYAGNGLLNNKKRGVKHSKIAQVFQILSFQFSGMYYKFTGAAFLSVNYSNEGGFQVLGSMQPIDFAITKVATQNIAFAIYIVPIILLVLLLKEK